MSARPEDTLLVERARDFLAGGPADAKALIERICQQSSTPRVLADRIAAELFAGRPEFTLGDDGLWRVRGGADAAPLVAEVARPTAAVPQHSAPFASGTDVPATSRIEPVPAEPVAPSVSRAPSFEEWRAQRERERAAGLASPSVAVVGARRPPARAAVAEIRGDEPNAETRLSELTYSVVDVETTGGSPHSGHRITEIAAVTVRGGEVCEIFETLVNPQRIIPPQIVKLTGITMEMVRDKPAFRDVCADVVKAVSGHVFVAHNVAFDWRFVSTEISRASAQTIDGPRLCTVRLARKLLPQLPSRSLGFVARHYDADRFAESYFARHHGPDAIWRHRAAGDAVATAYCLIRLIRDAEDRGCVTWGDVQQMLGAGTARAPRRRSAMPSPMKRDDSA